MKKYIYILLMALGSLGMYSCENVLSDEDLVWNKEEGCYADLTISMNVPPLNVESRTLASDPKNQGGSWTNWEKFVDGALLYRVTLFVIDENDENDKLVAYRNFYSESSDIKAETEEEGGNGFYEKSAVDTSATTGVAVKATFKSQNPMHGSIEKLKPGTYKLIAVANYAPIDATNDASLFTADETPTAYAGLGNVAEDGGNNNGLGGSFTEIVDGIIGTSTSFNGVDGFNQTNHSDFFNYKLNSGTDRVCKQLPQPLVMIRKVTLKTGKNQVEGELSRTFARVRLEVKRTNINDIFSIHDLSFAESYASQNAYLFNDVSADEDINLHKHFSLFGTIEDDGTISGDNATAGALNVNSSDCIIPSSGYTFYDNETTSYPLVDCYILEGKVKADYAFEFTATYWDSAEGGTATENFTIGAFTNYFGGKEGNEEMTGLSVVNVYIHDESVGTGINVSESSLPHYLLYSDTETIYSTNGEMKTSGYINNVSSSAALDPEYIWRINLIEKDGYPKYANYTTDNNGDITNGTAEPGIGIAYGNLVSIGSNLYLQPYDGSTTPKLGTEPAELIFRINFKGHCEVGTIFCKVGEKYYYLDSDSNHTLKWEEYTGNESTVINNTSTDLNFLTFSTINGSQGKTTNIPIQKPILNNSGNGTEYNEIVRNDFFYGIVPISISSSTANE